MNQIQEGLKEQVLAWPSSKNFQGQMKGIVGVDSEEGKGSTFWVRFPQCKQIESLDQKEQVPHQVKEWHLTGIVDDKNFDDDIDSIGPKQHQNIVLNNNDEKQTVLIVDDLKDMRGFYFKGAKKAQLHNFTGQEMMVNKAWKWPKPINQTSLLVIG